MTKTELTHLRSVLEAKQSELEELLRYREGITTDTSSDILDQIQHATEREMAIGSIERKSARLREVGAALDRIRLGAFGVCLDCEEEISSKRLAAVPWTTSCIVCREAADRRRLSPEDTIDETVSSAA